MNPRKALFFFSIVLMLAGCQKGPDDPQISLLSRKSRMAAKWSMTAGNASYTYNAYNVTYIFDGQQVKQYRTYTGGIPTVGIGKYSLSLDLDKNGNFAYREMAIGNYLECSGRWAFNSGEGDKKKKEQAIFFTDKVGRGDMWGGFFNQNGSSFVYTITELRKDKMQVSAAGLFRTSTNEAVKYTMSYIFEVK